MYYYFLTGYTLYKIYTNYFIIEQFIFYTKYIYKISKYIYNFLKEKDDEWILL